VWVEQLGWIPLRASRERNVRLAEVAVPELQPELEPGESEAAGRVLEMELAQQLRQEAAAATMAASLQVPRPPGALVKRWSNDGPGLVGPGLGDRGRRRWALALSGAQGCSGPPECLEPHPVAPDGPRAGRR
jgi:hypothetical protein